MRHPILGALAIAALTTVAHAAPSCPAGQAVTADTAGHCCWPGQAWSKSRTACVGIPECPTGTQAEGESCVAAACAPGQAVTADTAGHCCWPGQVWSNSRAACVGIPQCPTGTIANGEQCVIAQVAVNAPPSAYYPPPPSAYPAPQNAYPAPQNAYPPPQNAYPPPQSAYPAPQNAYPAPQSAYPQGAPVDPSGRVPVEFLPFRPGPKYNVMIQGAGCAAPCTLLLAPGPAELRVTGTGRLTEFVNIPAVPSMVKMQHFTLNEVIIGAVATPLGISMLSGGGWLLSVAPRGDTALIAGGAALVVVGTLGAITGIINLLTIHGKRVDVLPKGYARSGLQLIDLGFGKMGENGFAGGARFAF